MNEVTMPCRRGGPFRPLPAAAGALLTESIFGLAGVGRMLFEAITARDFPIVQAFTVVIAVGYGAANLLVDLSYALIDPRIKLD